ncbi:MAG TPA: 4-hydroxy-3-methylbut-2-enyl diphosphate reductase [Acidobacteriota bacterium]|jgi:4-hydroxy-3-methylbut-2-enyl diphosphate reductase|nr:4-hydroxy-3-methylbut-2-enyl diphosphate reductase [Acidobacteriota bacterium]
MLVTEMEKEIILARPRGFCAGVVRAIDIVNVALERFGAPLYVRKEIVHNKHVVQQLRDKGVNFVETLDEVPDGARVVFSAHGVSPEVRDTARARHLKVIDATCPLVTKVHLEAAKYSREDYSIILIGHKGHEEVEGTMGVAPGRMRLISRVEDVDQLDVKDPSRVCYLTQTTLSLDDTREIIDALKRKFPTITGPAAEDICYATQNRQAAVKAVATETDLVLVVGAANSSNSVRLVEVSETRGTPAYLIDNRSAIQPKWLHGVQRIGVTAGASAPEVLVEQVIDCLKSQGFSAVREVVVTEEDVYFPLPPELRMSNVE